MVASVQESRIVLIVARANFAFLGWDMEVVSSTEEGLSIMKPYRKFSLAWHHVTDLESWVEVPTKPKLLGPNGPLGLEQTGDAMFLPYARIAEGLQLTVKQCLDLLKFLGVPCKKNASKETLQNVAWVFCSTIFLLPTRFDGFGTVAVSG